MQKSKNNPLKFILLLLACILFSDFSFSQSDLGTRAKIMGQIVNPTLSFSEIQKLGNDYFRQLSEPNIAEDDERLEEIFIKWEEYWKDRSTYEGVKTGGDISGAKARMLNIAVNNNYCTTSVAGAQPWVTEGPNISTLCNIGIITAVAFDPNFVNTLYAGSNTGGLFKSIDAGANWTNITNNNIIGAGIIPALGISAIQIDPNNSNNIIVGTSTGAFGSGFGLGVIKSNDGGISWNISSMASAPTSGLEVKTLRYGGTPNVLFAGVGSKIYKSVDNGSNWVLSTINTPLIYNGVNQLTYSNCSGNSNVGLPFLMDAQSQIIDIEQDLINPNIVYASTDCYPHNGSSKSLISTDAGVTFNLMNLPTSTPWDAISIDVTPIDPGALYIYYLNKPDLMYCDFTNSKYLIAKTYNQGATWTIMDQQPLLPTYNGWYSAGGFGFWDHYFEMSDLITNNFLVGATTIYKATWSGSSYSYNQVTAYFPSLANNTHGDIRDLKTRINGINEEFISGCDGGIISSINGGNTWACINGSGLNVSQFYSIGTFQKSTNILASPQDNWAKLRTSSGWNPSNSPYGQSGESYWSEVDNTDDNIAYANINAQNGLFRSTDGGVNFNFMSNNPFPGNGSNSTGKRFYIDPTNHNIIWDFSANDGNLYKYNTQTFNWTQVHIFPVGYVTPVIAIGIAPTNSNVIYEAHDGVTYPINAGSKKLYKTIDGGANWTDITASVSGPCTWWTIKHILIDPINENRVFICYNGISGGGARVIFSNNGGGSWTDISNGLTGLSVNHMVYQNGSDDIIYAATDAGVYRWNKGTQIWDCFNLNLPNTGVRKVEINYCQNKLYASSYGRGLYSCLLPQIPDFHISSSLVNGINGTNTLTIPPTYNQSFVNRIIVDPGVYLKIQGALNFTGGLPNYPSDLIVAKQSHAVLTGTLSTNCAQLWSGVQVGGDINNNQNYSGGFAIYQGILEVLNGGTIQNAQTAISTGTHDAIGNLDWSSMGGVISCAYANFINNARSVEFLTYPFGNKSGFADCRFETNSQLLGGALPNFHVTLWNVNGVSFGGNDFRYTAGNVYPYGSRGGGIYSIDAKYNVTGLCTSGSSPCLTIKRGTFEDLNVGIETSNSNPAQTIIVRDNDFNRNFTDGARLGGMNYVTFVNNKLDVGTASSTYPSGLYLDNCKYYAVQNNTITTTGSFNGRGVYATNSGAGAHTIYRNTISNIDVGVAPQNDNSGDANYTDGLKIRCNTFNATSPNNYDIAMMGDGTPGQNPSVAFFQGLSSTTGSLLVGNKYAAGCSNENKWYVDNTYNVKGAYHANHADVFTRITLQPACSDLVIAPANTSILFQSPHCPDNYAVNKNPKGFNANISSARSSYNSLNNQYNALIDGGNTASLLALVNGNSSQGSLKNSLSASSPYLSDIVLSAYFSKQSIPPGHIKDIHGLNAPVSNEVWQILLNLNLPNGIKQNIIQQQNANPISSRTLLQGGVANASFDLELAYIDKITYYLNDSLPASQDTALATIKVANFADADCQEIAIKAASPNTTLTASIIDAMHGGLANVDGFCAFQKIIIQLNQTVQKIYTLKTDNTIKGQVQIIANDPNNPAQRLAQALLLKVFGTTYSVLRLAPTSQSGNRLFHSDDDLDNSTTIEMANNQLLQLYPNPTSSNFNVLLKGEGIDSKVYQLDIRNTLGQLIVSKKLELNTLQEISTTDLLNGLYLISLSQNNKLIKETKLVIMK